MKQIIRKALTATAGVGSFWAGLMWHVSAKSQMAALDLSASQASDAAGKLALSAAHSNLWAAWGAMVAGAALFALLLVDD